MEKTRASYNDSSISTKVVTIAGKTGVKLDATDISRDIKFVVFEAHHQKYNLTVMDVRRNRAPLH